MEMTMPNLSYFSIGFGGSMYKTDMIAWHSNGDDSYERDYYSYSKKTPELDEEQNLVNGGREFILKDPDVEDSYDIVKFVTYRDLDTNDSEKDFLVPLNEEIDMVYGMLTYDHEWREHNKRGEWSMKIHEGLGNLDFGKEILPQLKVEA